jgi:small-conductance mechanosensitive channel
MDQAAVETIAAVLSARSGVRGFNFSLGDVLGFLSVLTFGYLIARGLRFVLREEILPHWRLSRGVPETISTSAYYVLLLLVFFMSVNAAGIELDKLTVLTGAFGVGLGFGMQNIVNNFVSGLILQFERPIRVGDVLEVGNFSGEVRHIGIRASTMHTFQGADVIIPNSAFISGQVVNWTLSEAIRRVEIPIHVTYGTDPQRVIEMLLEIANSQTGVLRQPESSAVFMGFGESSLEFLLMFWADQNTHFGLRSAVSIRISAALRDEPVSTYRSHSARYACIRRSTAGIPSNRPDSSNAMLACLKNCIAEAAGTIRVFEAATLQNRMKRGLQMKLRRVIVSTVLMTACCLAQDVRYNFASGQDFSKFRTYKWVQIGNDKTLNDLAEQQTTGLRGCRASKKGSQQDSRRQGRSVHWISGGHRTGKQFTSYSTDWGYGPGWYGRYGGMGGGGMTTGQTSTIHVGQVSLDMYDPVTKKLVWRGNASKTLDPRQSPRNRRRILTRPWRSC